MKTMTLRFILLVIALPMVATGCFTGSRSEIFVPMDYTLYQPRVSADLGYFRGKPVFLMNVSNQAENTTLSTWLSPDQTIVYGDPRSGWGGIGGRTLESFFWYSIQRALTQADVRVSSMDNPSPGAPGVEFILNSMTDNEFRYTVQVYDNGAIIFSKGYHVVEPPAPPDQMTPQYLQQRAFRMIDRMVVTAFGDGHFQVAYNNVLR
jgi:hypothetical protein